MFFFAEDDTHGYEVWTVAGGKSKLFADVLKGSQGSDPYEFYEFRGELYFTADDGVHGYELWKIGKADEKVDLKILGSKLKMSGSGKVAMRLRCPASEQTGPCRGRVKLKAGKAGTLATSSFRVPSGKTKTVRLKLSKRSRKLVRNTPAAKKPTAVAKVRDGDGNKRTVRKRVRLAASGS